MNIEIKMNNSWIHELNDRPIKNTFKLAHSMLMTHKILFIFMSFIFTLFTMSEFLSPFLAVELVGQIGIVGMVIFVTLIILISQIFIESNYFYMCKVLLESKDEEECTQKVFSIKISKLFFEYFVRAVGSTLALIIMISPFTVLLHKLEMGNMVTYILSPLLYIYPLIVYKMTQSKNVNEAFIKTFSIVSPSLWKKSFNLDYAKFVISMIIIYVVFSLILSLTEYIQGFEGMTITIVTIFVVHLPVVFMILYVLPVGMMIAQSMIHETQVKDTP